MEALARVFSYGARKHSPHGWERLHKRDREAYFSKILRHVTEWRNGVRRDPETGLNPLIHAAADCLILVAMERFQRRR